MSWVKCFQSPAMHCTADTLSGQFRAMPGHVEEDKTYKREGRER